MLSAKARATGVFTGDEPAAKSAVGVAHGEVDFSLVLGGPLFQVLRRAHLTDDTLTLLRKRLFVIAMVVWLPLFVLSIVQGKAFKGDVALPFVRDLEVHIRFLVALPLLIVAELVVHQRMRDVMRLFRDRGIVPASEIPRFDAAVVSALEQRNSVVAELTLVAIVYGLGVSVIWRHYIALATASWYATPGAGGTSLTLAGIWYGYVSVPVFQFLLVRWYYRIFIWARFLYRVSRLELSLMPTHPDRMGGLGFLNTTAYAFAPLAAGHGALTAGALSNRIFFAGDRLTNFKPEIAVLVMLMLFLAFGPLLVFTGRLAATRRKGLAEYGSLAERYVRAFDTKWIRGGAGPEAEFLGSGDIQSLADLTNAVEVVRTMTVVPISRQGVIQLMLVTLAPLVPLLLTMMPLEELVKTAMGMLF